MKKLKNITAVELFYENVEGILIPVEYIIRFAIKDFDLSAGLFQGSTLDWMKITSYFQMMIDKRINDTDILFDFDDIRSDKELLEPLTVRLSERNDFVGFILHDDEGNKETIYVKWGGEDDYTNMNVDNDVNEELDVVLSCIAKDEEGYKKYMFETLHDANKLKLTKDNNNS